MLCIRGRLVSGLQSYRHLQSILQYRNSQQRSGHTSRRAQVHLAVSLPLTMFQAYQSFASVAPSRADNAYIFDLVQTFGNGLAAITSADELLVVDRQNLSTSQPILFSGTPAGTNCLVSGDESGQSLLCSGTDGNVATFDVRSQKKTSHFKIGKTLLAYADSDVHLTKSRSSRNRPCMSRFQSSCRYRVQTSTSYCQRLVLFSLTRFCFGH